MSKINLERYIVLTCGLLLLACVTLAHGYIVKGDSATATSTIGINTGNITEDPINATHNVINQKVLLQISNDTIIENMKSQEVLTQDDYWTESISASVTFLLALILTRKILIIKYPNLDYKN